MHGMKEKIVLRIGKARPAIAVPIFALLFATTASAMPTMLITKAIIESHPRKSENETQLRIKEIMPKTKDAIAIS